MDTKTKDWLLNRGGNIDYTSPRYMRRDIYEDRVRYEPTKLGRIKSGKTMWSHCIVTTSIGTFTIKSKSIGQIVYKYGNTLLEVKYVLRRGGEIVNEGRPHKF